MNPPILVVVSGLPASGKTTLGRALAERLAMPLIDKDEILEAMFDTLGCDDRDERERLSRASDEILFKLAASSSGAVLVNWWNHESSPPRLRAISARVVEVFCDAPLDVAASRFNSRKRHPGHRDQDRSTSEVAQDVEALRATFRGPLRVADHLLPVDTTGAVDADSVAAWVKTVLRDHT